MSITHEAYLNIVPGDSPAPIIKVSQYDADFSIVFHLIAKKRGIVPAYPRTVENDEDVTINVPTSATVSVRGTKTDGNGYSANATLSGTATAPIVTVAGHEQMTASAGVNVYEITFYADNATKRLSTANFILFVEPAALDASTITSESLMLELNDLIASVPNAVAAADRAEAAVQRVEGVTTQVAKNTQDISDIKADLSEIEPGLSDDAKTALLSCFQHVAWVDSHGQDYYNALEAALYAESYPRITAVFDAGTNVIYTETPLNSLKQYLVVRYYDTEGSAGTVVPSTDYTLTGTLVEGTSNVTVTYNGKRTVFNVSVTRSSSALYEISSGTDLSNQTFDTGISAFGIDDDFTILASLKVLELPTSTATSYVLLNNGTIGNKNILRLSIDEKNGIEYYVTNYAYGDKYQDVYTPGTVYANVEHDVIWILRNQNRQLKKQLYIDGTIRVNKTDDLAQYSSSVFSGNYTIGGFAASSPNPMKAVVDLFRIYDTALSISEINSLLNVDFSN